MQVFDIEEYTAAKREPEKTRCGSSQVIRVAPLDEVTKIHGALNRYQIILNQGSWTATQHRVLREEENTVSAHRIQSRVLGEALLACRSFTSKNTLMPNARQSRHDVAVARLYALHLHTHHTHLAHTLTTQSEPLTSRRTRRPGTASRAG